MAPQAPAYGPPGTGPPPPRPAATPGKATAALILGIGAIVVFPLGIVLGPIALVLGIQALRQLKRMPPGTPGNGLAVGGIVGGAIGIMVGLTVVLAAVVFVLVSNLGDGFAAGAEMTFAVDGAGEGGTLTVLSVNGTAGWWEYELGGTARCTLPSGDVEVGDEIVCVTDGDVVLIDWATEETVYATTV